MPFNVTPRDWRIANSLTLERAGIIAGVKGKNPARTWQRWERGEREPSIKAIRAIEEASAGLVNLRSWAETRDKYEKSIAISKQVAA